MELFIDPTDGRSIATQVYAQLAMRSPTSAWSPGIV